MPELPSGTVTFLFTDIERSTQTVEAMGNEAYADALDAHRGLIRAAFEPRGGHEVGTEGDAFFVAFSRAHDALAAAVAAQESLDGHPLRVRMGLHTGEALVREGEYIGHDVHKAKRVSDAGHGGQILLSQATAELVRDDVDLRDLGPHRLKDLGEPQRIYQVGRDDFPPLRSLEAFTHSLPMQRSHIQGDTETAAESLEGFRGLLRRWTNRDEPEDWPGWSDSLGAAMIAQVEGVSCARDFLSARPDVVRHSAILLDQSTFVLAWAIVCLLENDVGRSARLLGWYSANTFRQGYPPRSSADYMLYLHYRDLVRGALEPEEIARARDEGARLSYEEAVELGLGEKVSA